jgi:Lrp/AsnC family leucine-responsive transcriptional regulator
VEACHGVTGDDSYLLRVRVPDPRALEALLRTINALEGVSSTRTQLILSTSVERQRLV